MRKGGLKATERMRYKYFRGGSNSSREPGKSASERNHRVLHLWCQTLATSMYMILCQQYTHVQRVANNGNATEYQEILPYVFLKPYQTYLLANVGFLESTFIDFFSLNNILSILHTFTSFHCPLLIEFLKLHGSVFFRQRMKLLQRMKPLQRMKSLQRIKLFLNRPYSASTINAVAKK